MTVQLASDCRHGRFLYLDNDQWIGRCLAEYGEYGEGEVELFAKLLNPGDTVLEAGSNIGAHTVPLSRLVGPLGSVVAFEPQPRIYNVLCGNLALNDCANVAAYPVGVGRDGIMELPPIDYAADAVNFGGIALRPHDGDSPPIRVTAVDRLELPRLNLLKVDVEGMEIEVLESARDTIRRCRPFLYIEDDRPANSARLRSMIDGLGYNIHEHNPPIGIAKKNWRNSPIKLDPNYIVVSHNLFCPPR